MKILDEKDLENAQPYLDKVKEFILTVPPPVWELFWTSWIINNPNVTVNERRQLELTVANMEKSADLGDFDTANKHLNNLRSQLDVLWDKLPSNLLRAVRG